jgi:hypothetical protein
LKRKSSRLWWLEEKSTKFQLMPKAMFRSSSAWLSTDFSHGAIR